MTQSPWLPVCAGVALMLYCTGWAGAQTPRATQRPLVLPTAELAANYRDAVTKVVNQATIVARAAPEEFDAGIYSWLLDHPDRAALAWRRLGIPCAEIVDRGQGRFGWVDSEGTEVAWLTVASTPNCRVWYAEGRAVVSPRLPAIPVRAVAILHHERLIDADGKPVVRQQTDIYVQTDSKAAALVAKLLGPAMPRLAEQGAGQLLLFFSGLTRYFERHPQDIPTLLATKD